MRSLLPPAAALLAWASLAAAQPAAPGADAVRILPTGGLRMESAALLVSGDQGGSIHVAVLPVLLPEAGAAGGKVRVPVVLEIDGASLLKGNTGNLLRVEVCLYALAGEGTAVEASVLETIEADLPRLGAEVGRSGLQYAAELALPPGEHSLRALVRNAVTGEVGLRILKLNIPDPRTGPLLLAPVFANPAPGAWVPALTKSARSSPAALQAFSDIGLPAAQPVLGADQEARFELPVWKLKAPTALRVEVLRPDGGRVAELPARVLGQRGAGDLQWIAASFVAAGLEPGRYLLRGLVPGTDAPAWSVPVVVLSADFPGRETKAWAELMHTGESPPREAAAGPPEIPRPRRRKLDAEPIRTGYREALRLLANGDEPAARRALAALETPLLSGADPAAPEDVEEIELAVARDLAAARPQSLLPVVLLHESQYRDVRQRQELLLTTHTREMVFALAALYAEKTGDAAGRQTAARFLLALAYHLVESAPPSLREKTFQQVLAFDREDPAALLHLALEAERQGRYPEAVTHLERLLRTHPDNAEGRLRMAVNLRRLGKPRDADRLLDGLRAPAAEPWVAALAYHESGRALLAAGRIDDAQRVLREGLQRFPGDEKLTLELAEAFDRKGDATGARQLLAAFRPPRDAPETARHRYGRAGSDALENAWNDLVKSAPADLPALAEALRPSGARSGS